MLCCCCAFIICSSDRASLCECDRAPQVCDDYRLATQTAWTSVHYFDRYLAARGAVPIERDEAELISLTCVFVAAKFMERQSPVRYGPPMPPKISSGSPSHDPPPRPPRRRSTRAPTRRPARVRARPCGEEYSFFPPRGCFSNAPALPPRPTCALAGPATGRSARPAAHPGRPRAIRPALPHLASIRPRRESFPELRARVCVCPSQGLSDLCAVAAHAHPRSDFRAAEMLLLELLRWRLHTLTPHSYLPKLLATGGAVDLGGHRVEDVRTHADFFVDLSSFELLGFEYSGAVIAGASVVCALWRLKLADYTSSCARTRAVSAVLGDDVPCELEMKACIERLVHAFTSLESEHQRADNTSREGVADAASPKVATPPPEAPKTPVAGATPPPMHATPAKPTASAAATATAATATAATATAATATAAAATAPPPSLPALTITTADELPNGEQADEDVNEMPPSPPAAHECDECDVSRVGCCLPERPATATSDGDQFVPLGDVPAVDEPVDDGHDCRGPSPDSIIPSAMPTAARVGGGGGKQARMSKPGSAETLCVPVPAASARGKRCSGELPSGDECPEDETDAALPSPPKQRKPAAGCSARSAAAR